MSVATDPSRLLAAAALLLAYLLMCALIARTARRQRAGVRQGAPAAGGGWIVAFASQTGNAEELARHSADSLRLAGLPAHLCELADLDAADLQAAERVLFIVSTCGEGDPPDDAARFADRVIGQDLPLARLHYALLALGDSSYTHFCGFGKELDRWLQRQGAQALFERIEMDRLDGAATDAWRHQLSHLAGTSDAPDWNAPVFTDWRLAERRLLNPGSAGAPAYHLELEPADAPLPEWQAGDLAQIVAPGDPQPREYSIASIAADGRVHLLVRLHLRPDGSHGAVSGWLTTQAQAGTRIRMRLRQHRRFRLEQNAERPLILIGNGTGIAGLRSHLKARAASGNGPNWLLFGERHAASDFHYRQDIDGWLASGLLDRADLAFSRDQPQRRYVQHCLEDAGDTLRAWVADGAAIYVCGSLKGMAGEVDATLARLLGRAALDDLGSVGRYRRDVY